MKEENYTDGERLLGDQLNELYWEVVMIHIYLKVLTALAVGWTVYAVIPWRGVWAFITSL